MEFIRHDIRSGDLAGLDITRQQAATIRAIIGQLPRFDIYSPVYVVKKMELSIPAPEDPDPILADAIAALERDECDAVFFDSIQLKAMAEASGGRLLVTPLETKDLYGVAVDKRRPDVLAAANAVITEEGAK
jgi:ABC-type amino acid transport substrate-binding protein